jgi:hypothetical protein
MQRPVLPLTAQTWMQGLEIGCSPVMGRSRKPFAVGKINWLSRLLTDDIVNRYASDELSAGI